MGKIFCLMGKSASGKDTIYNILLKRLQLKTIVLYTTRPVRDGETDGETYYFVSSEEYERLRLAGKVIESRTYQTACGPWTYFTVDDGQIALKESNYLVIETLESYLGLQKYFGKENVVPLYLKVDDGVRLSRALERERQQMTPRYTELCRRFLADEEDFSEEKLQNAGITEVFWNEDVENCAGQMLVYLQRYGVDKF